MIFEIMFYGFLVIASIYVLVNIVDKLPLTVSEKIDKFYYAVIGHNRYMFILMFKPIAKVVGLFWYYVVVWFRKYSRNVVHNYTLQNNLHLPRLYQRNPVWDELEQCWWLEDVHNVKKLNDVMVYGIINYRKISAIEYYLVYWFLWGWVDDDSNHDTYDGFYIKNKVYGNAFDLGDVRNEFPQFDWKKSSLWNIRNSAYNFNYTLEEIAKDSKYNFYYRFTTKWFDWHFGYIPYPHKTHAGRLVFFSEDIDVVK